MKTDFPDLYNQYFLNIFREENIQDHQQLHKEHQSLQQEHGQLLQGQEALLQGQQEINGSILANNQLLSAILDKFANIDAFLQQLIQT